MTDDSQTAYRSLKKPGRLIGLAGVLLGLFALATPLFPGKLAFLVLGLLIVVFGLLQNVAAWSASLGSAI